MEGQIRGKDILSFLHGIKISHHGCTIVFYHKRSVNSFFRIFFHLRIKNFRKAHCHGFARLCILFRNRNYRNAGHIFTHIINIGIGTFLRLAQCFHHFIGTDYMYRCICLILCRISHTVSIDLGSGSLHIRNIQFNSHIVFACHGFCIEYCIFQSEIICSQNKGGAAASFRNLHRGRNVKSTLGGRIQLKVRRTNHLCTIPGFFCRIHKGCFKCCRF